MHSNLELQHFRFFSHTGLVELTPQGLEIALEEELLRIDVLQEDLMRIKITRNRAYEEQPTIAVCADVSAIPAFRVEETANAVRVVTSKMVMVVQKGPCFSLDAYRPDGSVIFESERDPRQASLAYGVFNDQFITIRRCGSQDAIFGLGEKSGPGNRKGRLFHFWNNDILNPHGEFTRSGREADPGGDPTSTVFDPYYLSIPFFYHMRWEDNTIAGCFLDNGFRSLFDVTRGNQYRLHCFGGQYTEYVFAGPRMAEILASFTWLTGRMRLPPLWALGHHQCRWHPYHQADLMQLVRLYREKKIPCEALWLDIDYMDGYRVFTWDQERFPTPARTFDGLAKEGVRVVAIVDPGVKYEEGYPVFEQGRQRDYFCRTAEGALYTGQVWPGKTAFPDFVRPEVREWWAEHIADQVNTGLAGIWNDMNEPTTGSIDPGPMGFGGGRYSHARYHNQYAAYMAMATIDGWHKAHPEQRPFVLSRAGSAGIQRYAANWLGDNCSRWEHLWMSLPMALGLGISGQPFLGADVGGFNENCTGELLARWYQQAVLGPFLRNHASRGTIDQYPWSFGATVENICRQALDLRYRLLPYLYTAFLQASETGTPVQRPLVFSFQEDRIGRDIDDEYLLGDHLLVAPVYQPGITARPVYLPQGTWHHWYTAEILAGPRFILAPAPPEYIPLFVRGGSVVPAWLGTPQTTMGYQPETIELHLFLPQENGEFHSLLYEDDGLTYAFQRGAYVRTHFLLQYQSGDCTLKATVCGAGYPEFRRRRFQVIFHGPPLAEISLDGTPVIFTDNLLLVENAGADFTLRAKVR